MKLAATPRLGGVPQANAWKATHPATNDTIEKTQDPSSRKLRPPRIATSAIRTPTIMPPKHASTAAACGRVPANGPRT